MQHGSGGFIVRNDLSAAGRATTIDPRGFVQAKLGTAAIGQGLQSFGQSVDQLGMVRLHAMNERKVLEADSAMRLSQADLAGELAKEQDTGKWEGIAAKHAETMASSLITKDLAPEAAEAIANKHLAWSTNVIASTREQAAAREVQLLGQQHNANFMQAVQGNDFAGARSALDDWHRSGALAPDAYQQRLGIVADAEKHKLLEDAQNKLTVAYMNGNESAIDGIMKTARAIPGVLDSEFNVMEQTAKYKAGQMREQNQRAGEREFLGTIAYQRANGASFEPSQVKQWVKDGKITEGTGAELLDNLNKNIGAPDADFERFITKVSQFDGEQDAKSLGKESQALNVEALKLGLNGPQRARFEQVWKQAEQENSNPLGRAQTSMRVFGRNEIHAVAEAMQKQVSEPDAQLLDTALQDREKLQRFGITDKAVLEKLAGDPAQRLRGNEAIQLFREAAKQITKQEKGQTITTRDAAEFAKLSPFEQQFLSRAAAGSQDAASEQKARFNEAKALDDYEGWWQGFTKENKRVPNDQEVFKFINDKTQGLNMGSFLDAHMKAREAAKPVNATPDKVSVRGFEPADDLALKLPPSLAAHAQDFIDAGKENNLDPYALAAISWHETGGGGSSAFREKNNAMGVSGDGPPKSFATVRDSIMTQAKTLASSDYYNGKNTLADIGDTYAPTAGATNDPRNLNRFWKDGVTHYYNILRR